MNRFIVCRHVNITVARRVLIKRVVWAWVVVDNAEPAIAVIATKFQISQFVVLQRNFVDELKKINRARIYLVIIIVKPALEVLSKDSFLDSVIFQ